MNRTPVESSTLKDVCYEQPTLEVGFKNGTVYQYFDVPGNVYTGLMASASKGSFFSGSIRNKFRAAKI